jgi:hypothetical protein
MRKRTARPQPRTLVEWRHSEGLAKYQAARVFNISGAHYGRLEAGTHFTTGPRAKIISAITGIPVDVLVGAA